MDVVATAGDCAELTRKTRAHHPDVAVVSLDDTPCRLEDLPVLMLAQSVDHERAMALLDTSPAGVGYLLEHRVPDGRVGAVNCRKRQRTPQAGRAADPSRYRGS